MTADDFRAMALEFPGAIESAHMDHPDFRVDGKIFASLGYPDAAWGMVKLTPEQQQSFVDKAPDVFRPCAGGWGRSGSTSVRLASVQSNTMRAALEAAHRNVREKAKGKAPRRNS